MIGYEWVITALNGHPKMQIGGVALALIIGTVGFTDIASNLRVQHPDTIEHLNQLDEVTTMLGISQAASAKDIAIIKGDIVEIKDAIKPIEKLSITQAILANDVAIIKDDIVEIKDAIKPIEKLSITQAVLVNDVAVLKEDVKNLIITQAVLARDVAEIKGGINILLSRK